MAYQHKDPVEICKKEEGFSGIYYNATLLAAIGRTKYLVRYDARFTDDGSRYLTEVVDEEEVRPAAPQVSYTNFAVSDRVEVYINFAWRVGTVTRKVDPNYYVRLDCSGNEEHCAFFRLRLHLQWENGRWFYPGNHGNIASTSVAAAQPAASQRDQASTSGSGQAAALFANRGSQASTSGSGSGSGQEAALPANQGNQASTSGRSATLPANQGNQAITSRRRGRPRRRGA